MDKIFEIRLDYAGGGFDIARVPCTEDTTPAQATVTAIEAATEPVVSTTLLASILTAPVAPLVTFAGAWS